MQSIRESCLARRKVCWNCFLVCCLGVGVLSWPWRVLGEAVSCLSDVSPCWEENWTVWMSLASTIGTQRVAGMLIWICIMHYTLLNTYSNWHTSICTIFFINFNILYSPSITKDVSSSCTERHNVLLHLWV